MSGARRSGRFESDSSLRSRAIEAYGMWGALVSHLMECSGEALDNAAAYVNVYRRSQLEEYMDEVSVNSG